MSNNEGLEVSGVYSLEDALEVIKSAEIKLTEQEKEKVMQIAKDVFVRQRSFNRLEENFWLNDNILRTKLMLLLCGYSYTFYEIKKIVSEFARENAISVSSDSDKVFLSEKPENSFEKLCFDNDDSFYFQIDSKACVVNCYRLIKGYDGETIGYLLIGF